MPAIDTIADLTVEFGFGVNAVGGDYFVLDDPIKGELDNATYLLAPDTVFIDVTDHVAAVSTNRGRDRETDEYGVGTFVVVLNDNDRTFDPGYTGSPYYGQLTPMRQIRVMWRNHALFAGWVNDWSVTYEPGDQLSRVTADGMDSLGVLGGQELATLTVAAHSGDSSGQRVSRILDRAEVGFPASRSVDGGLSTFGATTLGGNVLAYLQACARAEAGYLFVAADGTLTFRERTATLNASTDTTFSDDSDVGIPYLSITQRSAADLLYTRVTATSETTGVEVEAVDAAAGDQYLIRTLPLGTLFSLDDAETQNLTNFYLERFSAPEVRFQSATINVAACTEDQVGEIASLELTDVVTVVRAPLGVGSAIERLSIVDGIRHNITPGSWTVDLSFANADSRAFLMLDDLVFGALDSNRLAF